MAPLAIEGTQVTGPSLPRPISQRLIHTTRNAVCRRFANSCERGGSAGITSDDFEHEKDDANGKSDNPDGYEPH
jgi:hypothetical protein